ncbi:ParA family protein [Ralstonia solanacearum]|uniref:ParA family protein n=1 Tax=Ralstonia solanacearum TaxID=305 RepID=UPI00018167D6|nr:ParA family protein [Ralstonia solanacearum]MDC6175759.1 ParA family protein [Ralstonia solanacearum]MDC6209169.1 ParA family protein [Ralstonia solanacearum]MDC6237435.1 ParA family protein [Ralstonia solanacearum]MDD7800359.1 ParA family protein [Ralstonia solanacearum]TYZ54100.1 ParA family protein [Ralstonia solanacearum]
MPVAVVANPKGGVGKTTLATNLAGYFAARDHAVMLGDTDRQQSSREWLALRPATARPILTWDISADHIAKPPKGTTHVVLDTPAGLHGWRLADLIRLAGHVIVPLQPSMFDILATHAFLRKLADEKPVRHGEVKVGVVGMRVDMRTRAAEQLQRFVQGLQMPILAHLRDTQNYVQLAAHGLTLWDVAPSRVARDVEQWRGILDWLGEPAEHALPAPATA